MTCENRPEPAAAAGYDELTAIRADPVMRRHAQRLAGALAEDLLQQTWYTVARTAARGRIGNLRGYFYRTMVNTAGRMREEIGRHGIPVDDPVAAAGPRRGRELATASAEDIAVVRLLNAARRELLECSRAELRQAISACSPDPDRYRDAILAIAERMLADDGPGDRTEINGTLTAAYPEWFAAPGVAAATRHQRCSRGREDVRRVLITVIGA